MPESTAYCAVIKYSLAQKRLTLGLKTHRDRLTNIDFLPPDTGIISPTDAFSRDIIDQLSHYIKDGRRGFQIALEPSGTTFQLRVWRALQAIPVGERLSYGDIAKLLQTGPRAVGNACRKNPIPIVVPCHRVVAKSSLGGFAGATQGEKIDIKQWLLNHECNK